MLAKYSIIQIHPSHTFAVSKKLYTKPGQNFSFLSKKYPYVYLKQPIFSTDSFQERIFEFQI